VSAPWPLAACLDRPREGDAEPGGGLVAHLEEVGAGAEALARELGLGPPWPELLRLAGVLHDAGKARHAWQAYLRDPRRRRGEVPHAFWGAAVLFALLAEWARGQPPEVQRAALVLAQDVADHHGALSDLEIRPPWQGRWTDASDVDWPSLATLLRRVSPWLAEALPADAAALHRRVQEAGRTWGRWVVHRTAEPAPRLLLRLETACLVAADRFAVARLDPVRLAAEEAEAAEARVAAHTERRRRAFARRGQGPADLAALRSRVQAEALAAFQRAPEEPVYELVLPTGAGKTLAALRIALHAVARGSRRRIVYVAPYLSVLSQAAQAAAQATGLPVLEHHHLAFPEDEDEPEAALLAMEAWQAPVVATTFNQLFTAFFPRRAHQTIRLPALHRAFLVIDEPQIVDAGAWPRLGAALEAATRELGAQVLLVSATMPPWPGERVPVRLQPAARFPARYVLQVASEPCDAAALAATVVAAAQELGSAAAVVNTIWDAVAVFRGVQEASDVEAALVHGAMTALHKADQLRRVRALLDARGRPARPVVVVATQALEAGVDLTVQALWRARAVLPSVVQSAGRANRHAEGPAARVTVVPFVRHTEAGDVETRRWVYRDAIAREESDRALAELAPEAEEGDVYAAVDRYYARLLGRIPPGLGLRGDLEAVARGRWSEVAGTGPFGPEVPAVELFVPRDDWHDAWTRRTCRHFGVAGAREIWERHRDARFRQRLDRAEGRRWMALVHRFTVAVPFARAQELAGAVDGRRIELLADEAAYDPVLGLRPDAGREEALYL
jgi:CRISPR-associated endonuclease/helicase Cas3